MFGISSKLVKKKGRRKLSRKEIYLLLIYLQNVLNLQKALKEYGVDSTVLGSWKSRTCSQYYCLKIKEENIHG